MTDPILLWCDYYSMAPILVYFSGIYCGVYFNVLPEALSFTTFTFLNDQSTKLLKSIPYPDFMWDITRRPEGAYNTDYFSRNGPAKKDAPGFPSGHMTGITTFVLYMLLRKKGDMNWLSFIESNVNLFILSVGIVVMMGFARWYKNCHNLFQILGGVIYGGTMTYLYFEIIGKHLIN
tara:strand:+ start:296 stop:826 length:531 start_codon:yes stop_codon:yes gene_type:complete